MKEKTLLNNKVLYLGLMMIIIIFIIPHNSLAKSISSTKISLPYTSTTYTGTEIKPTVTVKDGNKSLKKDKDYKISYSNNIKVGTAKVTIKGINKYSGTVTKSFKIKKGNISKATVTLSKKEYEYSGKACKPDVTVRLNSKNLNKNTDYTVTYKNNVKIGKATVTIKGKGNYEGTITESFNITRIALKNEMFFATLNYRWSGRMTIEQFKKKSSDGQFAIKNGNVTAIYVINEGSKGTIFIPKLATNFSSITLSKLQNIRNNKTLKLGTDYSVKYTRSSAQTTITITGIGIYTGSKTIVCKGI